MLRKIFVAVLLLGCFGCKEKRAIPDVSKIKADFELVRSERDFFKIDTSHVEQSLDGLQAKYGKFLNDYLYNIVGLPPFPDSVKKNLPFFLSSYRTIDDSVNVHFEKMEPYLEPLRLAFKLTKYYFPSYELPKKVITFVGPMDGYGNVLTSSGLAVGLQMYMGQTFPPYLSPYIQQIYPAYVSRRFEPQYIPVNCVKNILDDMYPDQSKNLPLVQQMVAAGKKMYVLDALLPNVADTVKTGYTKDQLEGCYKKEEGIWNYFTVNNLLYTMDPDMIRDYMNDGPRTAALGDGSPGNIGMFLGWQIVKKWMTSHKEVSLLRLMDTSPDEIFKTAKYKPH